MPAGGAVWMMDKAKRAIQRCGNPVGVCINLGSPQAPALRPTTQSARWQCVTEHGTPTARVRGACRCCFERSRAEGRGGFDLRYNCCTLPCSQEICITLYPIGLRFSTNDVNLSRFSRRGGSFSHSHSEKVEGKGRALVRGPWRDGASLHATAGTLC